MTFTLFLGIEVEMDTHSKKNRNGKALENIIEVYLLEDELITDVHRNHKSKDIEKLLDIKLELSTSAKFDFTFRYNGFYIVEINNFSTFGSKQTYINVIIKMYKSLKIRMYKS